MAGYDMAALPIPSLASRQRGTPRGRPKLRALAVAVVVVLLLGGVIGAVTLADNLLNSVGRGAMRGAFQAFDSAGSASQSAARVAGKHGVAMGALTTAQLNAQVPQYKWVSGATTVPASVGKKLAVGIDPADDHVVTAVQLGKYAPNESLCAFGLSVASAGDPIVAQDHLPGAGSYVLLPPVSTTECRADNAPTTGWATYP